ncbi:MAG: nicotinate-nucleotide pyrophosphorylase, partial [Thermoleophilia bacterium]|nr:nicotinate-nucleotide pyrophosphorylase [Thermoleophilia bacterium]
MTMLGAPGVEPTPPEHAAGIELVRRAFGEDLDGGRGVDLTAVALEGVGMRAQLVARQAGVACGLAIAAVAFRMADVEHVEQLVADGTRVAAGDVLVTVDGAAASILEAERTALNVVQRLAGTATLT